MKIVHSRVICIKDSHPSYNLTKGKFYKDHHYEDIVGPLYYLIKNDIGEFEIYSSEYFRTIEDYRAEKLKELGI